MYKGYLIDLDGTAYVGTKVIKPTVDFVKRCKVADKKIMFLTNNASKTKGDIYEKLNLMGYTLEEDDIYTSAMAMAKYLEIQKIQKDIYLIGDIGLKDSLEKLDIRFEEKLDYEKENDLKKIKNIKIVVIGYTNQLTYKDLASASLILQNKDSKLFVTNKDLIIPNHEGNLPGNGAFVELLEKINNKKAIEVGKPTNIIMQQVLDKMGLNAKEVCMIGDNYKTDILAGINNNIDTIFVQTGVNTKGQVKKFDKQPTYILKDLSEYILDR